MTIQSLENLTETPETIITDEKKLIKEEEVSPNLKYIGRATTLANEETDLAWQICRYSRVNGVWTKEFAGQTLDYNKPWSNRSDPNYWLNPPPNPFPNQYSTLFDGINDYVTMGDAFNYEHSQQFSVALWIKPNNFAASRYFIGNVEADVDGWRIGHDMAGRVVTQTRVAGGAYAPTIYTDAVMTALGWNHVVMKWLGGSNNNQARVYLDGALSAVIPVSGGMVTTWLGSNNLEIGRAVANYFSGNIDEVTLWNKALSDSEVLEIYNLGEPADPTLSSMSANLVNWYRMGDGDTFPNIFNNASIGENGTMINMVPGSFVLDVP
jgi:hypothetical protein